MTSAWSDLQRPPLDPRQLVRDLSASPPWQDVRVVESTLSTNAEVAEAARAGAREGLVVVAEHQGAGRGRLDRTWVAPPRAALLVSALLRPDIPTFALPLLPLVAGLAVVEAVRGVAGVDAALKWPNDVLVQDRKLGGILVERVGTGVVVGIGLNVSTRNDELATPVATSIALEGGCSDRGPLLKELLRSLGRRYLAFTGADGAPASVLPAYREVCTTIGREVVVQLPGGRTSHGVAVGVDDGGLLVVEEQNGKRMTWSAGDVVHVLGG